MEIVERKSRRRAKVDQPARADDADTEGTKTSARSPFLRTAVAILLFLTVLASFVLLDLYRHYALGSASSAAAGDEQASIATSWPAAFMGSSSVPAAAGTTTPTAASGSSAKSNVKRFAISTPAPAVVPGASGTPGRSTAEATDVVLAKVATAEAGLRSGDLEISVSEKDGSVILAKAQFDLGGDGGPPRLRMVSSYLTAKGPEAVTVIVIGKQSWQQQAGGPWVGGSEQEVAWANDAIRLPNAPVASEVQVDSGDASRLRWYDRAHDADITLRVDPATGTPKEIRRHLRGTDTLVKLVYRGWNVPVSITPPPGS